MDVKIRVRVWEEEVTTPASMRRGRENLKKKMAAKPKQTVGQMMDLDTD